MLLRPLRIPDCVEAVPTVHSDERGLFLEWFRGDELEAATGRVFDLRQANLSVSHAGVARGIHFSDLPSGQAKYVTVVSGSVTDYAIDLRVGSPTFGEWEAIELDADRRTGVFLPEGIGHAFLATAPEAVVVYLTTDVYRPDAERTVSIHDPELALPIGEVALSPKDADAPTLAEARARGILPTFEAYRARVAEAAV